RRRFPSARRPACASTWTWTRRTSCEDAPPARYNRGMNSEDGHFEEPILKLRPRIEELSALPADASHRREVEKLREKLEKLSREIYANLSPWQKTLVARHPARPYALDYIQALTTDFTE